jgi:hypothetical protein
MHPGNFDKRDNLMRDKVYKREVFRAFWLVSQSRLRRLAGLSCKLKLYACFINHLPLIEARM